MWPGYVFAVYSARIPFLWHGYLTLSLAAQNIHDPYEAERMWRRAYSRLDEYFLEIERELRR